MSTQTSIEWTEQTWNPAVGGSKISPGCAHCYAEVMARRLKAMGVKGYENGFKLTLLPYRLEEPLNRTRPTVYFVNSMSDLFHEDIPVDYLRQVSVFVRFVSVEPLLEDLGRMNLKGIHWVIVGGESGPKARPMRQEWA